MSYTVKIRKNETQETVDYFVEGEITNPREEDTGEAYWWEEGNFSCDCNRELSFERAKGNDPDPDLMKCTFGRFSVQLPGEKQWI